MQSSQKIWKEYIRGGGGLKKTIDNLGYRYAQKRSPPPPIFFKSMLMYESVSDLTEHNNWLEKGLAYI